MKTSMKRMMCSWMACVFISLSIPAIALAGTVVTGSFNGQKITIVPKSAKDSPDDFGAEMTNWKTEGLRAVRIIKGSGAIVVEPTADAIVETTQTIVGSKQGKIVIARTYDGKGFLKREIDLSGAVEGEIYTELTSGWSDKKLSSLRSTDFIVACDATGTKILKSKKDPSIVIMDSVKQDSAKPKEE